MKQIARRFKFDKIETTAFSSQSNSSLERAHHLLCEYLKSFSTKKYEWDELLDFTQFHYNTSVHTSHQFTPYELIFAYPARIPSFFFFFSLAYPTLVESYTAIQKYIYIGT